MQAAVVSAMEEYRNLVKRLGREVQSVKTSISASEMLERCHDLRASTICKALMSIG